MLSIKFRESDNPQNPEKPIQKNNPLIHESNHPLIQKIQIQIHKKYAQLLVNYCLEVKRDDKVYVKSSWLAEPLLQEMIKEICIAGGHPVLNVGIQEYDKIMLENSAEHQLKWENPLLKHVMEQFDCYIAISAPFNLKDLQKTDPEKRKLAKESRRNIMRTYMERTATSDLRRNGCQYPTQASAQEAGMSLKDYEQFVYQSCFLFEDDPIACWQEVGRRQQGIVDYLNRCKKVRYVGKDIDISFSCNDRTWINSDGKTNMPSGEVFTAPVEDSVNGKIKFSYPSIYMGQEVEDVSLEVKDGEVVRWSATRGQDLLDQIFTIPGAKRFGEAAIGTNDNIQKMTKNILFDEKIGGTIHMALGQAYLHCGGKNESSIHWDLITDMKDGGEIFADDVLIYKNGKFLVDPE